MPAPLKLGVRLPVGRTGRPQLTPSVHRDAAVAQARRLTALADILGFDYVFSGGDAGLSSETTLALLGAARRLTVVAPISVTAWHPALLARFGAVAARLSGGRFAVDLRSSPHPDDHRVEEFARIVRELWAGNVVDATGRHFTARGLRPSVRPEVPPEIVVSGGWRAAQPLAARSGDWFLPRELDAEEQVTALASTGRRVGLATELHVERLDAESLAETLTGYSRAGVGLVVLDLPDPEAGLPFVAREVVPLVRGVRGAVAV
ncbi:LLM class flavin-dependent oxidoreductase [Cryptosporangium phraense]|uniref:LLM class flavin-dependent oxidoreductase n=1 Tax=Cryptosporangium phraense TaxID=2593070 RepID=A0A545AG28_9ACTN|nr:LLM class flavin-dependent oxidoreductase [Cryptosporangium phraense]TQS40279.1 LLM class flavin-dependent oxidoreductase [Cryptosporangium phraense]